MKFVEPLDPQTRQTLRDLSRNHNNARVRQRAHAVLLSDKGYKIDSIADIFEVDRDTVSRWLDNWQARRLDGLPDDPRTGRPPTLSDQEQDQALKMVLEDPRQIKLGLAKIREYFETTLSLDWLRDLLRRHGYRYKRMRTSLRKKRDEALFRAAQAELEALKAQEDQGLIDLYYCDESGFALRPVVPYAWQPLGQRIEVEQTGGRSINVLGFLRRDATFTPYVVESSINSATVIACLDHFAEGLKKETVVVLDNAPAHRSGALAARLPKWKEQGLRLYFLPSYAPELNLIELLWQRIKYMWMPLSAYASLAALKAALEEILIGVGTKYRITFA